MEMEEIGVPGHDLTENSRWCTSLVGKTEQD
jgi:hypothetical protein